MLHPVALVRTDVLEKRSTSIIRVTSIGELGTKLAVTSKRRTLRKNMSVLTRAKWRNVPEDGILQYIRRFNLILSEQRHDVLTKLRHIHLSCIKAYT
jgi:hypothetical protein